MNGKRIILDLLALVGFALVMSPAATGVGLHEWLSLALFAVLFMHCVLQVEWVGETAAGIARRRLATARMGNLVLDALVLVAFVVAMLSGLLVSGTVLPAFGLYAEGYYFWDPLHAISAKALLALLLVHVVVHAKWLLSFFRKKKRGDADRIRSEKEEAL